MADRPDLVIFDCDGVLVDSEPITDRVLAEDLTARGWALTEEETGRLFLGGTIRRVATTAREKIPDLPNDWVEQIYAKMFVALETVDAIPGVDAALDALDAVDLPYCIGSNGPHGKMAVTLTATGLDRRFEGRIYSAHDFADGKPAPDMFLKAAADFGAAPTRTVVVGDSRNDALAATAAGMRCLGYAATSPAEMFRDLGAEPFADMAELPRLLGLSR